MRYEHYLFGKYGHTYKFLDYADVAHGSGDIIPWTMVTMPMPVLVDIYKEHYNVSPKTFIDCGAGFGYMVHWASLMKIDARGIDVRKYPFVESMYKRYFKNGRIKICDLLDVEPFTQDLAYANSPLTYLPEERLDAALGKFRNVKMLIAIHTTTEDIVAAQNYGTPITLDFQNHILQSNEWWLNRFKKNGFEAVFDKRYSCFCAIPKTR
jgi:hypothetical protein